MGRKVSRVTAAWIARKLRARVDLEQFRRGMEEELEHRNVTRGNLLTTGKIALAHLKERPDYYMLLKELSKRPPLKVQERSIRQAARAEGLHIRPSKSLRTTPYRAMNPEAAGLLGQKCPPRSIIFDPQCETTLRRLVMDERHELIEHAVIRKLKRIGLPKEERYPIAHKIANKLQRMVGAERIIPKLTR